MLSLEPIGTVRSPISEGVDENWGDVIAEIHLAEHLASGLQGLDQFSHVLIVFWMHQSSFDAASDLVRRPRGRADMPPVGIFAQRAKHRPNPIGITAAELIGVSGALLKVRGLDAIDGTPVLDIKPYVPAFDRVSGAAVPEWIERLMDGYF
ncbi:MAG TPA: tRNA (N6-threonylcarbamoyladenosine(37)-N6)-methyltransferase TrmO [Herpetosiphonaceae bacterium]